MVYTYEYLCPMQHAADTVVRRGQVDGGRVYVMGGSHGGFLTGHLIGQYPVSPSPLCDPPPHMCSPRVSTRRL